MNSELFAWNHNNASLEEQLTSSTVELDVLQFYRTEPISLQKAEDYVLKKLFRSVKV